MIVTLAIEKTASCHFSNLVASFTITFFFFFEKIVILEKNLRVFPFINKPRQQQGNNNIIQTGWTDSCTDWADSWFILLSWLLSQRNAQALESGDCYLNLWWPQVEMFVSFHADVPTAFSVRLGIQWSGYLFKEKKNEYLIVLLKTSFMGEKENRSFYWSPASIQQRRLLTINCSHDLEMRSRT